MLFTYSVTVCINKQMSIAVISQEQTWLHQWRSVLHYLYAVSDFDPRTWTMPCGHWAQASGRYGAHRHAALNVDAESSALAQHVVVTSHAVLALVARRRVYWSLLLQKASTLARQQWCNLNVTIPQNYTMWTGISLKTQILKICHCISHILVSTVGSTYIHTN